MNPTLSRILFVEHSPDIIGGGQISVAHLARALRDKGHPVAIVLPGKGSFFQLLKENGFAPILLEIPRFRGKGVFTLPKVVAGLIRIVNGFDADVIHANSSRGALVGGIASRMTQVPMIWHLRVPEREFLFDLFLYALSTKVVAISKHASGRIPYGGGKLEIVFNGVEPAPATTSLPLDELRADCRLGEGRVLGTLAQLTPSKGLEFLLAVARSILDRRPDTRFLVVGGEVPGCEGYLARLEAIGRRLGIRDRIVFTGYRKNPYDYLALMDVFLFFSEREGFGRAVAEAMMASLPVVAADVGGVTEIVDPGSTGILIKPGDLSGATRNALRLLDDPKLRETMGKKGKHRAERLFSAEGHVENMRAVYHRLGTRPPNRRIRAR